MAPAGPPAPDEIERRFSEWNAKHAAIKNEFEAVEQKEEASFDLAKKKIEADTDQQKQGLSGSLPVHPAILQFLEEKRVSRLRQLERDYRTKKAAREQVQEQKLLDHIEAYSAFLGLAPPTSPANSVMPDIVKEAETAPLVVNSQNLPPLAADAGLLSPSEVAEAQLADPGSGPKEPRIGPSKQGPQANGHKEDNVNDVQSQNQQTEQSHENCDSPKPVPLDSEPQLSGAAAKRKAGSQLISPRATSKKTKVDVSKVDTSALVGNKDTPRQPSAPSSTQKKPVTKRSISFDEVYQDGNAEYKHMIIEYPPGEDDWYILRCDEHGVHFNLNPLHGAAKHLSGSQHNGQSKEHSLAIATLGHLVFDCDIEMAKRNNAAVTKAFENGYKPFNRNHLSKSERASMGFAVADSPRPRKKPAKQTADGSTESGKPPSAAAPAAKAFAGITNPVAGELYRGYWSKNKTRYAVMVLPWGDLSLAGMYGTLSHTGLLVRAPRCYVIDRAAQEIRGWAKGYEDGGPLVTKREFPVMYFDGARSVGWLRAKDLSLLDMEDPESDRVPYFHDARDHYARAHGFDNYEAFKVRRQELGLPVKRHSDVLQPSLVTPPPPASTVTNTSSDALTNAPAGPAQYSGRNAGTGPSVMSNQKMPSPSPIGNIRGEFDAEMIKTPIHDDDTDSCRGSETREWTDVEMADSESRRTSVSIKALAQEAKNTTTAAGNVGKAQPTAGITNGEQAANTSTVTSQHPADSSSEVAVIPGGVDNAVSLNQNDHHPVATSDTNGKKTEGSRPQAHSEDNRTQHGTGNDGSEPIGPGTSDVALQGGTLEGTGVASDRGSSRLGGVEKSTDIRISEPTRNGTQTTNGQAELGTLGQAKEIIVDVTAQTSQDAPWTGEQSETSVRRGEEITNGWPSSEIPQSNGQTHFAGVPAGVSTQPSPPGPDAGSHARSLSSTPGPISKANSRASTPIIVRAEDMAQMSRWRAVRSEPPSTTSQGSLPLGRTNSLEPTKETPIAPSRATITPHIADSNNHQTPAWFRPTTSNATGVKSEPYGLPRVGIGDFELAAYEDDQGGSFFRSKDGPCLRLIVDPSMKSAEAEMAGRLPVKIDPANISRIVVEPLDDGGGGACRVSLTTKEGADGPRELKLVFEATMVTGREENGRIHARRFCRWATRVNAEIDYRNKSFDSSNIGRQAGSS